MPEIKFSASILVSDRFCWLINRVVFLDWEFGFFRDCNGISNGRSLSEATLRQEKEAGLSISSGRPAGLMGPKLKLRYNF